MGGCKMLGALKTVVRFVMCLIASLMIAVGFGGAPGALVFALTTDGLTLTDFAWMFACVAVCGIIGLIGLGLLKRCLS